MMEVLNIIDDLRASLIRDGLQPGSEPFEICNFALECLGLPYLRTEELAAASIDCSTLTSQAHWIGAAIGIPFIAETQRTASSGTPINASDSRSGDIWIRYPTTEASPDGLFNHVGLFMGRSSRGEPWIVESRGSEGVRLTRAEEFAPNGGIKRYWQSERAFNTELVAAIRKVCSTVPKLGRLGARQYTIDGRRMQHLGIDIYCPVGTEICASSAGKISIVTNDVEKSVGITIDGPEDANLRVTYFNIEPSTENRTFVNLGQRIGRVVTSDVRSLIRYTGPDRNAHLHFEVDGASDIKQASSQLCVGDRRFFNGLYLAKLGVLRLPVRL
jgi:hypothetical protein